MPQTANSFNPDEFLAQTQPNQVGGAFDPDQFLAQTSSEAPPPPKPAENPHDLVPFLKAQGHGFVNLAKQAGSGLIDAASDPGKTASDVANSIAGIDPEGIYRAVRNVPLVGDLINTGVIGAQGIVPYFKAGGGDEGKLAMVNAQDTFEEAQKKADAAHEKEHPLTDFIQKNVGLAALPQGKIAQTGMLAVDAFQKSMAQGNDVLTALKDARNTAMLAGTALNVGEAVTAVPKMIGKYAAKEAGVSPEAIARYMEAPEEVNAAAKYAEQPESLKNLVDDRVAPVNQAVETAQNTLDTAKGAVAGTRTPPASLASEIPAHLDSMGEKLHDLSGQAFDILSDEGHNFPASELSKAVENQMNSLKIAGVVPSVGPDAAAYGAMGKFKEMVDQIGNKFGLEANPDLPPELVEQLKANPEFMKNPDVQKLVGELQGEIPAPVVKQLIQQLDGVSKDAYTTNAGALTPSAAKNLAAIRRTFDQTLKQASPAYAEKMAELAPKVGIVSDLSNVFGNEPKAMFALQAAADPMSPRGIQVRDMLKQYDQINGTDFAQRVADYYDAPRNNLKGAQEALETAKAAAQGVNKLGPNSTESAIKSIQGGRNIEARKQLEGLDPQLAQTVKDAAISKQFGKATTNGSRKAVIGRGMGGAAGAGIGAAMAGPTGAVVGGFLGQAAGGALGGLADMYGGQAVKTALDAGIKIDKLANTPYIKPLLQAAQKSPKSLAVVHYMLTQTDPKYQALTAGQ